MEDRGKVILGITSIAFLIFIAYSFITNVSPYKTVSEVLELKEAYNIQVNGTIVANSTKILGNTTTFELTDGKSVMKVIYQGTTHYQENIPVVVVGDYKSGVFHAYKVLTKCHTEYKVEKKEEKDK
jgi:cytochrome c-type biogenesis protein CcmE